MLNNCELLRITSRQTALLLCQHIQPQVCLPKSILVEKNSIATHLFLLHRGTLHVTLGDDDTKKDGKKNDKGKKKGPHMGKGKAALRMRVCERMGSFVGIYDPYEFTARLPLEVVAVKLSQLFAIQRHDLIDVMDMVGEFEAQIFLAALEHEKKTVLEALKYHRPERKSVLQTSPEGTRRVSTGGGSPEGGARPSCDLGEGSVAVVGGRRISQGAAGIVEVEGGVDLNRKKQGARAAAKRRASVCNAAVGSLLQSGSAASTAGAVAEAAANATVMMWDEAVNDVKVATRSLEEQCHAYKKEVKGFVHGLDNLSDLLQALQAMPEASLPQAPGPKVKKADYDALPSFRGLPGITSDRKSVATEQPVGRAGARLRTPQLVPVPIDRAALEADYDSQIGGGIGGGGNGNPGSPGNDPPPDSGSRLLDGIKGMWDGFTSQRQHPGQPVKTTTTTTVQAPGAADDSLAA